VWLFVSHTSAIAQQLINVERREKIETHRSHLDGGGISVGTSSWPKRETEEAGAVAVVMHFRNN
jgi:hypothetical protein